MYAPVELHKSRSPMNWLRLSSYVALALLIIPVIVLLYVGLGPKRTPAGYNYGLLGSIELTFLGSAISVLICVVLYTPLAYYFARNNSKIEQTISDIPASIPHPIIGIALLVLVSPITELGQFLIRIGFDLFNTLLGYVVCLVIVSAPIYIKAMQPSFESMNRSYENYAAGLGASQLRTFFSVVLPNSGRGILSASLIGLSRSMSEYGSIAIIAYVILQPRQLFGLSPSAVYIVSEYNAGNLYAAITSSAVLILISIPIMVAFRYVQRPPTRT
jgi:molybdate/tungstate transport system permease protein